MFCGEVYIIFWLPFLISSTWPWASRIVGSFLAIIRISSQSTLLGSALSREALARAYGAGALQLQRHILHGALFLDISIDRPSLPLNPPLLFSELASTTECRCHSTLESTLLVWAPSP
ncbi:hypothetical protein BJV74DRAFT_211167 [Russula compacta]|nr:hypothetical protein BJV74DRAFT_211167 [Russula compacta]